VQVDFRERFWRFERFKKFWRFKRFYRLSEVFEAPGVRGVSP